MAIFKKKNPESKTDKEGRNPADWTVLGAPGNQFFSGFLTGEEYLAELQGQKGIAIYDKMRRNDAQVRGTLAAITLPIRAAKWFMKPASEDKLDVEIAQAVEKNLLEGMSITWDDFLRQALTKLPFGFSMFELLWEFRKDLGLTLLRKLAPRLQKTLYKWIIDEESGDLKTMIQYVQMPDGSFQYPEIPEEKLLLFVHEQEGNNFEGLSVLRSSYGNWYMKNELYKIDSIGHDRWASGVPYAQEEEDADPKNQATAKAALKALHSREQAYLYIPKGHSAGILEKKGSNDSILKSIQHHDEQIAKNVLAQLISLGSSQTGSRALGDSFEQILTAAVNAEADYIKDMMNRNVVKKIVDNNWTVKQYPKLNHSRIILNIGSFMEAIAKVGGATILTRDEDVENLVRKILGLPEIPQDEIDERRESRKVQRVALVNNLNKPPEPQVPQASDRMFSDRVRRRELSDIEVKCADLDLMEFTLDDGVDRFEKQVGKIRRQQAEIVARDVVNKQPENVKPPLVGKLADRLNDEYVRMFKKGKHQAEEELKRQEQMVERGQLKLADKPVLPTQINTLNEKEVLESLKSTAKSDATILSNKVVNTGLFAATNVEHGLTKAEIEKEVFAAIQNTNDTAIKKTASRGVNGAFQMGRQLGAESFASEIEYAVYSTVLDMNACDKCLPKDGVKHELNDPDFQTPNPECEGGPACRCVNIYKLDGMEGDFLTKSKDQFEKDTAKAEEGRLHFKDVRDRYQ